MQRSGALAAGFRTACAADGVVPPPTLGLLRSATSTTARDPSIEVADPWDLGTAHERVTDAGERSRRGAWYTPRHVAEALVADTVTSITRVADPACGGGVFLLAVADRLVALGASPHDVLTDLIVGIDVNPLAVATTEAALWWWGARHGIDCVPSHLTVGDLLVDTALPTCGAVVGNPPFLGQLRSGTVFDAGYRDRLRRRFGDVIGPYTDPAWLFLLAAVDALETDGRATLIQPQSMLAARDAERIRQRIDEMADLEGCWIDDGTTFAASVEACAPTLRRRATAAGRNRWVGLLADHRGIPDVALTGVGVLGDLAAVRAGFRDQYYGLVDAVTEGGDGPRLVTSGAIDPLHLRGDRSTTFAKARWHDPRLDLDRVEERARAWVQDQLVPSVLVASQTRVLECLPDPDGGLVVGVPGIAVIPRDSDHLWRVTAVLAAPCVSAWMLRHTSGTGLSGDACRPTAPLLSALPLPVDEDRWDEAATRARRIVNAPTTADGDEWRAFGRAADAAYGVTDPTVLDWWDARRPG